mmetsp:Transcript_97628/g.309608  ORF Transcript_97628/g.309608 Transcript_97628/m.309608 type:complete len:219 (+) Transcript_97628:160-816(+)
MAGPPVLRSEQRVQRLPLHELLGREQPHGGHPRRGRARHRVVLQRDAADRFPWHAHRSCAGHLVGGGGPGAERDDERALRSRPVGGRAQAELPALPHLDRALGRWGLDHPAHAGTALGAALPAGEVDPHHQHGGAGELLRLDVGQPRRAPGRPRPAIHGDVPALPVGQLGSCARGVRRLLSACRRGGRCPRSVFARGSEFFLSRRFFVGGGPVRCSRH